MRDISQLTSIKPEDCLSTLQHLNFVKLWKGQHIISVPQKAVADFLAASNSAARFCNPAAIRWAPKGGKGKRALAAAGAGGASA